MVSPFRKVQVGEANVINVGYLSQIFLPLQSTMGLIFRGDLQFHARREELFGSSRFTGEGGLDLEEEVVVITEAVGHAFEDLDLVVHALQH